MTFSECTYFTGTLLLFAYQDDHDDRDDDDCRNASADDPADRASVRSALLCALVGRGIVIRFGFGLGLRLGFRFGFGGRLGILRREIGRASCRERV